MGDLTPSQKESVAKAQKVTGSEKEIFRDLNGCDLTHGPIPKEAGNAESSVLAFERPELQRAWLSDRW
jgi:hypothetical protein